MPSAAATYSLLAGANPLEIVHHSDRGSQYVSEGYTADLKELGVQLSVGSTGDSYDNALAEVGIPSYSLQRHQDQCDSFVEAGMRVHE